MRLSLMFDLGGFRRAWPPRGEEKLELKPQGAKGVRAFLPCRPWAD
jgi:hypothetical protein